MLITFAFILTPLIPLQDPILRRTPIPRPAGPVLSKKQQAAKAVEGMLKSKAIRTKDFAEFRAANGPLRSFKGLVHDMLGYRTYHWTEHDEYREQIEENWKHVQEKSEELLSPLLKSSDPQEQFNAFLILNDGLEHMGRQWGFDEERFLLHNDKVIALLVDWFKDDDVKWNRHEAWDLCYAYFPLVKDYLENAMFSEDTQQRCAAIALVNLKSFRQNPSRATLEIQKGQYSDFQMNYFLHYQDYYYEHIVDLFRNGGADQVVASYVIAINRMPIFQNEVTEVLIRDLVDDNKMYNGSKAARALFIMGDMALPSLESIDRFEDKQQEAYIKLLIWDIQEPPQNKKELEERREFFSRIVGEEEGPYSKWIDDHVLQGPAWGRDRGQMHWLREQPSCMCSWCLSDDRDRRYEAEKAWRKKTEAAK